MKNERFEKGRKDRFVKEKKNGFENGKNENVVMLRKGKEAPIRRRHHWIYNGAVQKLPKGMVDGGIYRVVDFQSKTIGHGYFNRKPKTIVGRMLNFEPEDPIVSLRKNIRAAIELREKLFADDSTNSYRIINGEADRVPGLIVDKYNDVLVIQISTLGIEKLKSTILDMLALEINPKYIYEKSNMPSRSYEGMSDFDDIVWINPNVNKAEIDLKAEILENNMKFEIDIKNSHKTGFYLDQRDMRELIKKISNGKRVLNCFSYTGGFSVAAALGGARHVTSVDISEEVIKQAEKNFKLNNIETAPHQFIADDVFKYLDSVKEINEDIVILDPPAFAKKKSDFGAARSGYRRLNRSAMRKMKPGSFLLTCSCSYHMDKESFFDVIRESAAAAGREVKLLQTHRHAMDHLINIYHGEMDYLKSYLLWIE